MKFSLSSGLRTAALLMLAATAGTGLHAAPPTTAASPAMGDVTADPDDTAVAAPGDADDTSSATEDSSVPDEPAADEPAADEESGAEQSTAATVPDIEDTLPDTGRASHDGTGTVTARASAPGPAPQADSATAAAQPSALPAGTGTLDSATMQRIIDRLLQSHFLASTADAEDPARFAQAVRDYQGVTGLPQSGTLDRDTIGRLIN